MSDHTMQYRHVFEVVSDGVYFLDRNMRILFWNKGAERITGFLAGDVIGKHYCADILKHVDGFGFRLCNSDECPGNTVAENGKRYSNTLYFQHKLGHRVPVAATVMPLIDDSESVVGTAHVFAELADEEDIRHRLEEYQKLALLDPLTEIGNRRLGVAQLQKLFGEHQRYGTPFGVAYIDIDNFKRFNDLYGHKTGDVVLKTVARTLVSNTRTLDHVMRWGGEEFLSVLKNVNVSALESISNKLRTMVEHSQFQIPTAETHITVSIGATLCDGADTLDTLLDRADQLMYYSKAAGRNKVTIG